MKKSNILILLAIPMVLASCGKKGNSSSVPSVSSDIPTSDISSSLTSNPISSSNQSSQSSDPEIVELSELDKFVDGYNKARVAKNKLISTPRSTTITETLVDKYFTYTDTTSTVGEKNHTETVDTYNDWYVHSYDAGSKTGYVQNDDDYSDVEGVRSMYAVSWVKKSEGKYLYCDTNYSTYSNVGEDFAWYDIVTSLDAFTFLDDNAHSVWKNDISQSYSYLTNFDQTIKDVGKEYCGTYTKELTISSNLETKNGVTTFSYTVSATTLYVAPKLPSVFTSTQYLTDAKITSIREREYVIKDGELVSTKYKCLEKEMTELKDDTGSCKIEAGHDYNEEVTISNKYTDCELPSLEGFNDDGIGEVRIRVFDDANNVRSTQFFDYGTNCALNLGDFLSPDDQAAGVSVKLFADEARTKEVDATNFLVPGNSCDLYISYSVPSDLAYVIYDCRGIFSSYDDTLLTYYQINKVGSYVGSAKKNYFIPAYECTHVYNNYLGDYIDVMMAPFDTIIVYTTDETAKMNNDRMLNIKEGHIYYLSSYAAQVD